MAAAKDTIADNGNVTSCPCNLDRSSCRHLADVASMLTSRFRRQCWHLHLRNFWYNWREKTWDDERPSITHTAQSPGQTCLIVRLWGPQSVAGERARALTLPFQSALQSPELRPGDHRLPVRIDGLRLGGWSAPLLTTLSPNPVQSTFSAIPWTGAWAALPRSGPYALALQGQKRCPGRWGGNRPGQVVTAQSCSVSRWC